MTRFARRDQSRDSRTDVKSPYSTAITGEAEQVRALKTGWWAHQGSNLGPDD